jgi:importin-5
MQSAVRTANGRHYQQGLGNEQVETIYLGDRRIQIRTSVLEEKSTACNMLCCYADELKEGFLPWVQQVKVLLVGNR